jgi:hypothetical protein
MKVFRRSALVLGLSLFAALAEAAPVPSEKIPDEPVANRAALVPFRKFQVLPGKVLGVFVSEVAPVMNADGRGGPLDAIAFSRDAQSYRWVYVPVSEKPLITNLRVEVGEKPNAEFAVYPSLGMANPKLAEAWNLKAKYALAEVEVNDGKGSPPTEGFVATKVTVLDGSRAYPIVVADAVEKARKLHAEYLKGEQKSLDDALAKAQKDAIGTKKATGPRKNEELLVLTWMADKDQLQVAFVNRTHDGAFETRTIERGGGRGPLPLPVPPRGEPVAFKFPPPPMKIEVTTGTAFGIDFGRVYVFDKNGKLVGTKTLRPTSYKSVLPVPPGAEDIDAPPQPLPVKG